MGTYHTNALEMTYQKKVTIIVPMFNASPTLERSISSIKSQTYKNLDVIFVDDASTDNSVQIAEQLFAGDDRFRLLTLAENAGPSTARNRGLDEGAGDYVFFADADDWLPEHAIESLLNFAEENRLDLTSAGHFQARDENAIGIKDGGITEDTVFGTDDFLEYIKKYMTVPYVYTAFIHCWGKLYRYDLIRKYQIRFDVALSQMEDVHFNCCVLRHARTVGYKAYQAYFHRIERKGSSLSTVLGAEEDVAATILRAIEPFQDFMSHKDPHGQILNKTDMDHLMISMVIIAILRNCRQFVHKPRLVHFYNVVKCVSSDQVGRRAVNYNVQKGESKLLSKMIKLQFSLIVFIIGIWRVIGK